MSTPPTKSSVHGIDYYRQILFGLYEEMRGPPTGVDYAREVRLFQKTFRFTPPQDSADIRIVWNLFKEHLQTSEPFFRDYRRWIELRDDRRKIQRIAEDVCRADALKIACLSISRFAATIYQELLRADENTIRFIVTGLCHLGAVLAKKDQNPNDLARTWSQFRELTIDVVPLTIRIENLYESIEWACGDMKRSLWSLAARLDMQKEQEAVDTLLLSGLEHEFDAVLNDVRGATEGMSRLLSDASAIKSVRGADAVEKVRSIAKRLSEAVEYWYDVHVSSVFGAARIALAGRMGEIELALLRPLEALVQQVEQGDSGAWEERVRELQTYHARFDELMQILRAEFKLFQDRLNQVERIHNLPRELVPEISFVRHDMKTWMGCVDGNLQLIKKTISPLVSSKAFDENVVTGALSKVAELTANVRDSAEITFTNVSTRPALEFVAMHFHGRKNASVSVKEADTLPAGIDNEALRKLLSLLVMNAIDFPRKGVPLAITIAATSESLVVQDNGFGMTPKRLEEVREAIRTGRPLESDHGGTGRGLIDATHYLTRLFPHSPHPATMDIQSQFGVGSTFTINFPLPF